MRLTRLRPSGDCDWLAGLAPRSHCRADPSRPPNVSHRPLRYALAALTLVPAVAGSQRPARQVVVRHVQRLTAEDGLGENNLRTVVRDGSGFIWVVTRRGILLRYDGRTFVDFQDLVRDAGDVAHDVRFAITADSGVLWVFTGTSAFRLSREHDIERRIPLDGIVNAAAVDGRKRLWYIDQGVLKWVDTSGPDSVPKTVPVPALEGSIALAARSSRYLWVAARTNRGTTVFRIDPGSGSRNVVPHPDIGLLTGIHEDAHGYVWLSGVNGLAIFGPGMESFRALPEFRSHRTTPVVPDESGSLFVATDDWLARVDSSGVMEYFTSIDAFGRSALLNGLTTDNEGGVWLATTTTGLLRLQTSGPAFAFLSNAAKPPFPVATNFITALREGADGSLWLGTMRGGAYRITAGRRDVKRIPVWTASASNVAYDVWDFEDDSAGNLWMATSDGICRLVASAFRCHAVAEGVVDIERTPDGWFWLAAPQSGVISFDPHRERFGTVVKPHAESGLIVSLHSEADSGYLWLGTGEVILRIRVAGGAAVDTMVAFPSTLKGDDLVYQFYRDRRGELLAGTGGGLLRRTFASGQTRFEAAKGLESLRSPIFSIVEDSSGRIWLGSALGLLQYSPATGAARRYGKRDNFLSGELNRRAAIRLRNGHLAFGGVEGLTEFNPDVVAGSRTAGPLVFTRWSRMTPDGPMGGPITGTPAMRVAPGDRSFTIEFAELSYAPTPGRRFRYRLEGLSTDWVETTEHAATYAAPPAGRYEFRVQSAAGGDDAWPTPGIAMTIEVAPPFWNTTWFRLSAVLLTALLVVMAHRWKVKQAVLTERLRLRISRDLHDEIGAGLSSIALLSDKATEPGHLQRIGESARNMVADLRDIVWAIDPEADRGRDVEGRMRDVAATLLRDIKVTWDLHADGRHIGMETRRDLLRLYKEILHNVAKHARATEATISLRMSHDSLELTVSDNGAGFVPNGAHRGTGLKSLRERAARLGGELYLESTPGSGTTVRFVRTSRGGRKRVVLPGTRHRTI